MELSPKPCLSVGWIRDGRGSWVRDEVQHGKGRGVCVFSMVMSSSLSLGPLERVCLCFRTTILSILSYPCTWVSCLSPSMIYTLWSSVEQVNPPSLPWIRYLWNTPLGKYYNGTSVHLRTLVIVRITIWIFLASLLGTRNLASRLWNTNKHFWRRCRGRLRITCQHFAMFIFFERKPWGNAPPAK
jgi:hypothetical protein